MLAAVKVRIEAGCGDAPSLSGDASRQAGGSV